MVTIAIRALLALLGLIVSARTHITAAAGTAHLNIPVLGVVALAIALVAAALVLWLARVLLRDGLRLQPKVVSA